MEWRAVLPVALPVCMRASPQRSRSRASKFAAASNFPGESRPRSSSSSSSSSTMVSTGSASLSRLSRVTVRCSKEDPGVKDRVLDNEQDELEAELQQAIQSEDYAKAAIVRDRLRGLQQDCVTGVLEANARFYRAFEQGDLAAMRKMWKKGDRVHCVHPGAGRISGHELVMSSWEVMLGPEVDLPLRIQLEHVEVAVKGDFGYVSCLEVVRSGSSWGKQVATNVFERRDGVWEICMHHASPSPDS